MTNDGGRQDYDPPGNGASDELVVGREGGSRRGWFWFGGVAIALLSVGAGFAFGGRGDDKPHPAASLESTATQPNVRAAHSPAAASSEPARSTLAPPSSLTPTATASSEHPAAADYTGLLAAVSADGDVVLVDPDTAAVVRTLVHRDDITYPLESRTGLSWDARSGVVYFAQDNCTVWRYRIDTVTLGLVAEGRRPAISPDGTRLAVWTCSPGLVGELAIVDANSGTRISALRITREPDNAGGGMWYLADIDWRPDGNALVVTAGWEGEDGQYLVDLRKPPPAVTEAPQVPITSEFMDVYHETEYVGQQLVMSGGCCSLVSTQSFRVVVRDGRTGALTSLFTSAAAENVGLSADAQGRMRFLRHDADKAGALWALDRIGGVPRRVGGEFNAIDW